MADRPYLRAIDTTSRRLALMKCWTARLALLGEPLELLAGGAHGGPALGACDPAGGEQVLGQQSGLDGLGQLYFGGGVEQRRASDLVEVQADTVAALDRAVARLDRCGASCCHGCSSLRRLAISVAFGCSAELSYPGQRFCCCQDSCDSLSIHARHRL